MNNYNLINTLCFWNTYAPPNGNKVCHGAQDKWLLPKTSTICPPNFLFLWTSRLQVQQTDGHTPKSKKYCDKRKNCNFFFCHNVFKNCQLQMCQNVSTGGKMLTLSRLQTHFDAIAADDFFKNCDQRWNCSSWAISPLATLFSTLFNN